MAPLKASGRGCPNRLNFGPVNCPNPDPGSKYHVRGYGVRRKASRLPSARHAESIRKASKSRELDTAPISAAVCSPIRKLRECKLYGACRLRRGASCSHFVAPCYSPSPSPSPSPPAPPPTPLSFCHVVPAAAPSCQDQFARGAVRIGEAGNVPLGQSAPCTGFPALARPLPRRTRPRPPRPRRAPVLFPVQESVAASPSSTGIPRTLPAWSIWGGGDGCAYAHAAAAAAADDDGSGVGGDRRLEARPPAGIAARRKRRRAAPTPQFRAAVVRPAHRRRAGCGAIALPVRRRCRHGPALPAVVTAARPPSSGPRRKPSLRDACGGGGGGGGARRSPRCH